MGEWNGNAGQCVLIVGAGPTGLTLANDLARRGVPFQIIESKAGPSVDSKGLALNVSSQYGLRLLGIGGAVGAHGRPIRHLNIHWNGRKYSRVNFDRLQGDIRTLLTQPQAHTEAELLAALRASGHDVAWSHRLSALEEHADHVGATIETGDGQTLRRRYQYVVGCDGKRSLVRDMLGASFEGKDYPMYFVLGDFAMTTEYSSEEVQYFVYEDGFFILVPIGAGVWRVVVKYDGALPATPPSAADITGAVNRYLARCGKQITFGAPLWMSHAPFYHRVAGRIGSPRLFIAGDAAHLFSPIGGTGMNTGIQDALNLGWKLAFVHHGISASTLLSTYEAERLPAIREAAAAADLSTRLITGGDWQHPLIQALAPAYANRALLRKLPLSHSGMALTLPLQAAPAGTGAFSALYLHLAERLAPAARRRAVCLVLCGTPPEARARIGAVRERLAPWPGLHLVFVIGHAGIHAAAVNEDFIRMAPAALAAIAPHQAELSLIRPDGIVVHACRLQGLEDIGPVLSAHFHLANQHQPHLKEAILL